MPMVPELPITMLACARLGLVPSVVFGGFNTQHVLIEGTPELIRTETSSILEIMKPGGGYIASASHDYLLPETPVENVLAMFETVRAYGAQTRY